jgi:hypothetical protein
MNSPSSRGFSRPIGPRDVIVVTGPRCCACGSRRLRAYRTLFSDETGSSKLSQCRDCGKKMRVNVI